MAQSREEKTWNLQKRIGIACSGLIVVFLIGVVGFKFFGGGQWTWLDAFYMTVITLATVGYGETHPLSPAGRVFTIFLILCGIGAMTYSITAITDLVLEGDLREALRRRRLDKKIERGLDVRELGRELPIGPQARGQ